MVAEKILIIKMISRIFLIAFICLACLCKAQSWGDTVKPSPVVKSDTNISIVASPSVSNTIQKVQQYEQLSHGTFPGFRIQVHFGTDRTGANSAKSDIMSKYPSFPSYLSYQQPYFKVCVGDFRTKLEAASALNKIKRDYPGAFVVRDKINPPPLH